MFKRSVVLALGLVLVGFVAGAGWAKVADDLQAASRRGPYVDGVQLALGPTWDPNGHC